MNKNLMAEEVHEGEQHNFMFKVLADIFMEIFGFFKYIFYDVFRGEAA